MSFTWKPFFNELFVKVTNEYNPKSLATVLYKIFPENGMMDKVNDKKVRFKEIDPLVFLARFNRSEKIENKIDYCKKAKEELNLKSAVPSDFDGIPIFNNMNFWFSPYSDERVGFELDILWEFAKQLANDKNIQEQVFNKALESGGAGPVSLTDVCYIVWPNKYLPLDRRTKGYISSVSDNFSDDFENIKKSENPHKSYLEILENVKKNFPNKGFEEISLEAYYFSEKNYWLAGAYWRESSKSPEDKTNYFIENGVWLNGFAAHSGDESIEVVKKVNVGDYIAIKSSSTKGAGHKTSFIKVKAIGIVEANKGDGVELTVNWVYTDEPFDVDGVSYRKTFEAARDTDIDKIFGEDSEPDEIARLSVDLYKKSIDKMNAKQKNFLIELSKFGDRSVNSVVMAEKCGYASRVEANSTIGLIGGIIRDQIKSEKIKIKDEKYANYELVALWINNGWKINKNLKTALQGQNMKNDSSDSKNKLLANRNIIFYGPPGTGKTRQILELQKEFIDKSVTDNKDAVVKWIQDDSVTWWDVIAGALVDLDRPVAVPDLLNHDFIQAKLKNNNVRFPTNTLWKVLQTHAIDSERHKIKHKQEPLILDKDDDSKWFLTGDWQNELTDIIQLVKSFKTSKTNTTEEKRFEMVTFHQSYSYEEFVEGIRPHIEDDGAKVTYKVKDGVFKKICQRAQANPSKKYAIFIDEINRGNISKVFGELITLIEEDKRIGEKYGISDLKLPYSDSSFGVPSNLYIIGTMNSVDRSIALVDMALRRRFSFHLINPDSNLVPSDVEGIKLRKIYENINNRISVILGNEYKIGHSYFTDDRVSSISKLQEVWFGNILPLLQEYLFDDWEKLNALVKDFVEYGSELNELKDLSLPRYKTAGFISSDIDQDKFIKFMKELE